MEFVEPNRIRHHTLNAPNDPFYGTAWWLQTVQALQAWNSIPGQYLTSSIAGTGRLKVAILDSGADCTHFIREEMTMFGLDASGKTNAERQTSNAK